jgi:hypothetical protein
MSPACASVSAERSLSIRPKERTDVWTLSQPTTARCSMSAPTWCAGRSKRRKSGRSFEAAVARIEEYLAEGVSRSTKGLAVFARDGEAADGHLWPELAVAQRTLLGA